MDEREHRYIRGSTIVPGVALALYFIVCSLVLRPYENLPFIDDWTYAWSVEQLLKTGELRITDWSAHYPLAQILWGTIFCLPFGFSFSALRVSTVVLAWLGALGFYATLRELGRPRADSLIATFVFLVNPVFFILTFSYMTDVPFVSFVNIAFFFFISGMSRQRESYLWIGSFLAICAFFTRQVAVALPIALFAYCLVAPSHRRLAYLLPLGSCLLFLLSTPLWISQFFGFTKVYSERLNATQFWFQVSPLAYAGFMMRILLNFGLVLCPLTLPWLFCRYRKRLPWIIIFALGAIEATLFFLTSDLPVPLLQRATWSLEELGPLLMFLGSRFLVPATALPSFLPAWLNYPLALISLFSVAVIIAGVFELMIKGRERKQLVFFIYTLCQIGFIFVLWLFHDRYYLVVLPPLIVLLVSKGLARPKWIIVGICLFLVVALTGTWDNLQASRAVDRALSSLRQQDIPMEQIDAGYALNGWNLYVHPENLPTGVTPNRDVASVTTEIEKPYVIAVFPLPGYRTVRVVSWSPSFWAATNKIYILEKVQNGG